MEILIDAICEQCQAPRLDVFIDRDAPAYPLCPHCGIPTVRLWQSAASVHGDDIPGGLMVEHGLCNADGSPRRYDSRSEMAREAKARGLVNWVEHKGDKGSDKSPNTQRFI